MSLLPQVPPIRVPIIYHGRGSLDRISKFPENRIFIVTDKIARSMVGDRLVSLLAGKDVAFFDETEPNPKDAIMVKAAEIAQQFKPELIIGIGGGSVMDTAKGSYFLYGQPTLTLSQLNIMGKYDLQRKSKLVLVPTTSGTGSEGSAGLVFTDSETGKKTDVLSFELIPWAVILDPTLAATMPKKLTISSGVDAFAQGIESASSPQINDILLALDLHGIKTLVKYLPLAAADGANDLGVRDKVHYAASMIGFAMGNAGLGIGHACGHAIGGVYNIAHGLTVGAMLPYAIEFNKPVSKGRYAEILDALHLVDGGDATAKLAFTAKEFLAKLDVPSNIKDLGISPSDWAASLDKVVQFAVKDACLSTNPRPATADEVRNFLQYAYEGKTIDF